jgi:serine/threonine-protein kinase
MIGRTLSHYKVLEEISRGGMGIVYRALDLKLDREVALKVLPPELVADPKRKRRFILRGIRVSLSKFGSQ